MTDAPASTTTNQGAEGSPDPSVPFDEISAEAAQQAFHAHLIDRATKARLSYGLHIDTEAILKMLDDRDVVRYPVAIVFDADALEPHEFAFAQPAGFHASDGFALCIHPQFRDQREIWPLLIAYHIPVINYGKITDPEGAELYGATLLGLEVETYYEALCELADSIGATR